MKMVFFTTNSDKIFLQKVRTALCLFGVVGLSACFSNNFPNINENFEKKYGKDVEKINSERAVDQSNNISVTQSPYATDMIMPESDYYAYVDVKRFNEHAPKVYLPNGESYEQTRRLGLADSIPPDIFDINYNLGVYSAFRVIGAEFDRVNIPSQDVYGIKTKMSDKEYLLAGNDALQRSIDEVGKSKNSVDIENSEILIKERRAAKIKAQMKKNFGSDEAGIVSLTKKEERE